MYVIPIDIPRGHYKWYHSLGSNTAVVGPSTNLLSFAYVNLEFTNVLSNMELTSLMLIDEQELSLEILVHCMPYN